MWWLWAVMAAWSAEEQRDEHDGAGRLVKRQVVDGDRIVSETSWTYDDGVLVEKKTVADGVTTVEQWTTERGKTLTHVVTTDGLITQQEAFTYDGPRMTSKTVSDGKGVVERTTYTYDPSGRLVETQVTGPDGSLRSRALATWAKPDVPVVFSASGSGSWATLADTFGLGGGFSVSRRPDPSLYRLDPLEFSVGVTYAYARAQGLLTTSDLRAHTSLDFNELWPRLTLFLFSTVQHNPVANLNAEIFVAPLGVKYTLVRPHPWSLDASLAPLWNYRSIEAVAGSACDDVVLAEDGECSISRLRASLRVRAGYDNGRISIKDRVEFLPDLDPERFLRNLDEVSILRNTLTFSVALSENVSISENFVFTRDRTLASQFDCDGGDDNPACRGLSFENVAALNIGWKVGR